MAAYLEAVPPSTGRSMPARNSHLPCRRSGEDDRPFVGQQRKHFLHREMRPASIQAEVPVKLLGRRSCEWSGIYDAGMCEDDMHTSLQLSHHFKRQASAARQNLLRSSIPVG